MTSTSDLEGDNILVVQLSAEDLNAIKQRLTVATASTDTYLTVVEGGVQDTCSNPLAAISNGAAIRVGNYTSDTTSPTLEAFSLDLTNNTLTLTFSETVLSRSLNVMAILLQNSTSWRTLVTLSSLAQQLLRIVQSLLSL